MLLELALLRLVVETKSTPDKCHSKIFCLENIDQLIIGKKIPGIISLVLDSVEQVLVDRRHLVSRRGSSDTMDHSSTVHQNCLASFWLQFQCVCTRAVREENVFTAILVVRLFFRSVEVSNS